MTLPDDDPLVWMHSLQVDRASRCAWMYALSGNGRFVAARIGYDPIFEGGKATLEMFLADKPGGGSFFNSVPLVLDGERIVLVGGVLSGAWNDSNFEATAEVWLFHTVAPVKKAVSLWWILPVLLLAAFAGGWAVTRVRKRPLPEVEDPAKLERNDLQTRITDLVEEKQLFLIKDLKITDIARELGTNATYISACINGQMGISFPEFISRYRVEYALKLMQEHPEMSSVEVWDASGFNNEKTFIRRFRLQTGMTPAEWKKQHLTK
jgi:AraC-like DNA-binding protein